METSRSRDHVRVVPAPLLFAGGLVAGHLLGRLRPATILPPGRSGLRRTLGAVLAASGLALGGWAARSMRAAGTTPNPQHPVTALVQDGPFQYSRNPIYIGMIAAYLGVALWRNARWSLLLLPAIIRTVQRGAVSREEPYLRERFGDEYTAYQARVRRWI